MNQELQDYIKKSKEAGMSDEQIKQELLKVGWKEEDISQEFNNLNNPTLVPTPTPIPTFAPKAEIFSEPIKQRSKSKLPIIALIVAVVVLLAGVGVLGYNYLIKPSVPKDNNASKDINTWGEYNDDLCGIQFQYPVTLKLRNDSGVSQEFFGGGNAVSRTVSFLNLEKYNAKDILNGFQAVVINVYRSSEVDTISFLGKCTNMDKINENNVSFGNKIAKELVCALQIDKYPELYKDYNGPKVTREYIIKDTNFSYFISAFVCHGENKSDDCNKFISSFKFVEPEVNLMAWGKIYKQNSDWYLSHMKPGLFNGLNSWTKEEVKLNLDNAICGERKEMEQVNFDPTKIESTLYKPCKEYLVNNSQDGAGVEGTLNGNEIIVKRITIEPAK